MNRRLLMATAITLSTFRFVPDASAQTPPADAADSPGAQPAMSTPGGYDEIIVTGTRERGRTVQDSPAPIQVLRATDLQATGQPDLIQSLNRVLPAFNVPAAGFDTGNLILAPRLRGLSPDDVLVLINGKRRHTSANLNADSGPAQGSAPVDLDLIPAAAIDHIEVLQDGAAAQYGSDAIAGVINIILKSSDEGGTVSGTTGQYYDDDGFTQNDAGNGFTIQGNADVGMSLGPDGFLHLSTEIRHHDNSNHTGPDPRITVGDPFASRIAGDAEVSLQLFSFNAGINFDSGIDFYTYGTVGHRHAKAWENDRLPSKLPQIYPNGFEPAETLDEYDIALTTGIKGDDLFGWTWDLATTYGADDEDIGVVDSGNVQLYAATGSSPTVFHAGEFKATQWTNNADISRPVDLGIWGSPLNIAFGAETRHETYALGAGDYFARFGPGSQSFPGFSLTDVSDHYRDSVATYVDLSTKFTPAWQVDLAGRFEHYGDFGDTENGKLTTRYDFSPEFGVRATISNGFRAPSLAQGYFSATNVTPTQATVQLPANSPAARLVGGTALKPETSTNFSVGLVAEPLPALHVTVDAYQVKIKDRVVDTGTLSGAPAFAAIVANGNSIEPGVSAYAEYFTNGVDTRTRGLDINADYPTDFGDYGKVDWSVAVNLNQTAITKMIATPAQLAGQTLFDPVAIAALTTDAPRNKVIVTATWDKDPWSVTLRETRYGHVTEVDSPSGVAPYYPNTVTPKYITDLEISYFPTPAWHIALGADNLFNVFPNSTLAISRSSAGVPIFPYDSPFGFNGGYYYTRVSYSF